MADIYDIDFQLAAMEILPTHKRTNITEVTNSITKPLNDLNLIFKYFRIGSGAANYSNGPTYTFGQIVKYSRRIYLRNEVTDSYVAGTIPTNAVFWTKILDDFVGVTERVMYGNGKLIMEYALNRAFGTMFRNPPLVSDIYIENINTSDINFFVGEFDTDTGTVSQSDVLSEFYVGEGDFVSTERDFIVYVPLATYNALGSTTTERDSRINSVVDSIKLAGYDYKIQTY